mmetsp:Transcript_16617/g.14512  ORF Transcript_16617/g.14512 Transcript_16617/m.14512 type:complete len:111 (-) Transcript_16617:100-432(-)
MSKSVVKQPVKGNQLRRILFDHINKNMKHMNLRVSGEIETPAVTTQTYHMKLPEVKKLGSQFRRIKINHKKTGIMRRNKLLLEHIMHERIRNGGVIDRNFRTNVSVNCVV